MPATRCYRKNPRRAPMGSSHGSVILLLNDSSQESTLAVAICRRVLTSAAILHPSCGADAQYIEPNLASEQRLTINAGENKAAQVGSSSWASGSAYRLRCCQARSVERPPPSP